MSDLLFTAVPGLAYFAIRLADVPPRFILGGRCTVCSHIGPVDRHRIARRWPQHGHLKMLDRHLRCLVCGNGTENRFTVVGTYLVPAPPAEIVSLRRAG